MSGTTLLELLVVLVILGIATSGAGVAIGSLDGQRQSTSALQRARLEAIRTGRAVLFTEGRDSVRFLPDGRAIPNLWTRHAVDPLTGGPGVE